MNNNISILTVLFNPLNDYMKSFSRMKDKRQFWTLFFFFFFGFTGIPMIKSGQIKKGLIILLCLIAGVGSNFLFDIAIVRQIFCIIWLINYIGSFWELLKTINKKWALKVTLMILCFVPIEFIVVYFFRLAKWLLSNIWVDIWINIVANTQLHSQAGRKVGRAWQLPNISCIIFLKGE